MELDGTAVPMWEAFSIPAGSTLKVGQGNGVDGSRCYIALSGGFDAPIYLGSRSTFPGGNIGGYQGRALQVQPLQPACATGQ